MTATPHTTKVIEPNPGAPVFAAELSEELGAVVLSLNEDVNLVTPEATRDVAHQAAAFSARMYALAQKQAGATAPPAEASTPVTITAPDAAEPLITAGLFTGDHPDDSHTVAAVYPSWNSDADLDSAGLGQLISNITAALPGLYLLRNQLAAIERGDTDSAAYLAGLPSEEITARGAFSTALDAIEAAFAASQNPAQTRDALRTAVDMYADEARA